MIKTKSIYDSIQEEDGERILVFRYWPRGISRERLEIAEWMRDLAPSPELLEDWGEGDTSWTEYSQRYREEMASQEEAAERAERARTATITLLC